MTAANEPKPTILRGEVYALSTGVAAYFAVVYFAVHFRQTALVTVGMIAFWAAYLLSRKFGPIDPPGKEPAAIMFMSTLLFVLTVAGGPLPNNLGFVAAAIGAITTEAIWAVHRYLPDAARRRHRSIQRDVRWGIGWGLGMAAVYSLWVGVLFAIGAEADRFSPGAFWLIAGSYFAGGIIGGVLAGLLRPLTHRPLGAMLMGAVVAFPIYMVIALILPLIDPGHGKVGPHDQLIVGIAGAIFAGPTGGLVLRSRATVTSRTKSER